MKLPLKWEFPGGKIEPGEKPEECLKRELVEELGVNVDILKPLPLQTHSYPQFTVTLYPFICSITAGEITLHEHAAAKWLAPEKLLSLDWAEADLPVIEGYLHTQILDKKLILNTAYKHQGNGSPHEDHGPRDKEEHRKSEEIWLTHTHRPE